MQKPAHYKWVLVVTELFNIAVNDSDAKKSAHCNRDEPFLMQPKYCPEVNLQIHVRQSTGSLSRRHRKKNQTFK